jgi:hypothetical protein
VGAGPGNYKYGTEVFTIFPRNAHPHNLALRVLSETGAIGLALAGLAAFFALRGLGRMPWRAWLPLAAFSGFEMLDEFCHELLPALGLVLCAVMAARSSRAVDMESREEQSPAFGAGIGGIGWALGLVAAAFLLLIPWMHPAARAPEPLASILQDTRVDYIGEYVPKRLARGETGPIRLRIRNGSGIPWSRETRLVRRWYRMPDLAVLERTVFILGSPVAHGADIRIEIPLTSPASPGRYLVQYDLELPSGALLSSLGAAAPAHILRVFERGPWKLERSFVSKPNLDQIRALHLNG